MFYNIKMLEYIWEKGDGAVLQARELNPYHEKGDGRALVNGLRNRGILVSRKSEGKAGYTIHLPPGETAAEWQCRIFSEFKKNCGEGAKESGLWKARHTAKFHAALETARREKILQGNPSNVYDLLHKNGFIWNPEMSSWLRADDKPLGILRRKK